MAFTKRSKRRKAMRGRGDRADVINHRSRSAPAISDFCWRCCGSRFDPCLVQKLSGAVAPGPLRRRSRGPDTPLRSGGSLARSLALPLRNVPDSLTLSVDAKHRHACGVTSGSDSRRPWRCRASATLNCAMAANRSRWAFSVFGPLELAGGRARWAVSHRDRWEHGSADPEAAEGAV